MRNTKYDSIWVVADLDCFIIVERNGEEHCMIEKYIPGFAFERLQALKDIEFSMSTEKAFVIGLDILMFNRKD